MAPHQAANQSLCSPCGNRAGTCMGHSKYSSAAASLDTAVEIQVHSNNQSNSVSKNTKRKTVHAIKHLNFKWILLTDFQRLPKWTGPMPVHSYKNYLKCVMKCWYIKETYEVIKYIPSFNQWSSILSTIGIKIHALKKKSFKWYILFTPLFPSAYLLYIYFKITLILCSFLLHLTTFPNQQNQLKLKASSCCWPTTNRC